MTHLLNRFNPFLTISTHTLTWSVTCKQHHICPFFHISTHTLTWSVTKTYHPEKFGYDYFNSHAHVERDCLWNLVGGLIE